MVLCSGAVGVGAVRLCLPPAGISPCEVQNEPQRTRNSEAVSGEVASAGCVSSGGEAGGTLSNKP